MAISGDYGRAGALNRGALVDFPLLKGLIFALLSAGCIWLLLAATGQYTGVKLAACFVLAFFCSMGLSTFLLTSFYHNILFVTLVNSLFPAYCMALVMLEVDLFIFYGLPHTVFVLIFVSRFASEIKWRSNIPLILYFLVMPSILGTLGTGLVSLDRAVVYLLFSFVTPLFFFTAVRSNLTAHQVERIICVSFMILVALNLIFIPVEILVRGSGSVHTSEVGGRAYSLIAILILIFPVLKTWLHGQGRILFLAASSLLTMLVIFSFSRGVVLFAVLASLPLIVVRLVYKPRVVYKLVLLWAPLLLLLFYTVKDSEFVQEVLWFWSLRLNIFDNNSGLYSFDLASIVSDAGRMGIWQNALHWSSDRLLFGYGIGSSPELTVPGTGAPFGFGGMHNQSLTVLVERGVFALIALLALWALFLSNLLKLRANQGRNLYFYCFFSFLLFVHTTGIELLVISTKDLNSNILVYLLMMFVLVKMRVQRPI